MKKIFLLLALLFSNVFYSQNYNLKIDANSLLLDNTAESFNVFNTPLNRILFRIKPKLIGDTVTFYANDYEHHIGYREGYLITDIINDASSLPFDTAELTALLNAATGSNKTTEIIVTPSNAAVTLSNILPNKEYVIDGKVNIDFSIEIPQSGIHLRGFGPGLSELNSTADNNIMFTSPINGSGDIFIENLSFSTTGVSAKIYDLVSFSGTEILELETVNYNNCTSLGVIDNYDFFIERNTGRFSGTPVLEFSGIFDSAIIETSIVRDLSNITTLFKAGTGFSITGRFLTNINCDLPATGSLFDFTESNIVNNDSFIISNAFITREGIISTSDTTIYPNISNENIKCAWKDNTGLPNTVKYGYYEIAAELVTPIALIDTYYPILGTWQNITLSHFDMPANGEFRLLSGNGTYRISAELVVVGTRDDELEVRITKSADNGVTYPIEVNSLKRQINALTGARDVAFFPVSFIFDLMKGDRIRLEVKNKTAANNITAELSSYIIITD